MAHRVAIRWGLALIAAACLAGACGGSSGTDGWKTTQDASGSCQVSTPPDWQPGRDFYLAQESAVSAPVRSDSELYPPRGVQLWGVDGSNPVLMSPLPSGDRFQLRTSLVHGDKVCSVWRVKETTDFSADETQVMEQVGKTLQAVP